MTIQSSGRLVTLPGFDPESTDVDATEEVEQYGSFDEDIHFSPGLPPIPQDINENLALDNAEALRSLFKNQKGKQDDT